jgi:PST family polysaccharide transporter
MSQVGGPVSTTLGAAAEPARLASLDRALVRGIAWTGTVKWGSQVVAWLATLVVARTLTPADYGLYAMATMFLGLVGLLSEFGIGTSVVMLRDLADEQVAQINALAVMLGIAAFSLSCALAVPLGRFFAAPELPAVVIGLSTAFVITAFRVVPYSLLQKELRFKWIAFVDGTQTLVTSIGMVVFALYGFKYWTFVVGALLGAIVSTALVLISRRHQFAWPRPRSLTRAITFSRQYVVAGLAYYVSSSADLFVAGKMLGHVSLGVYSFASTLATMLPDKIAALMTSVTPSIFSSVQTESVALRRYLLSLTEGIALITFPAALGLAFVADDLVTVVLGEKWRSMVAPLQILAAYAAFRSIAPLPATVLTAIGEMRFVMWNQILAAVLLPAAFYLGSRWGAVGIATGWAVAHPALRLLIYRRAFRRIDLSAWQYLAVLSPALGGSLLMLLAIWTLSGALSAVLPSSARLGIQVLAGIVVYALAILALQRHRLGVFRQTWRLLRS